MIIYSNLTQLTEGNRFIYIRSTDIEQSHWERLLWSVPDELLFFLSKGEPILIKDKSTDPKGGKICRVFCPVINDLLNYFYFNTPPEHIALSYHFNKAKEALYANRYLKTKYKFWRGKIPPSIVIVGLSIYVNRETNLIGLSYEVDKP